MPLSVGTYFCCHFSFITSPIANCTLDCVRFWCTTLGLGNLPGPIRYLEPGFQCFRYILIFSVTFSTSSNTFSEFAIYLFFSSSFDENTITLIPLELPFYPVLQVSLSNTVLHFWPTLLPTHNTLLVKI